ncbi:MAG: glycosyltransferase [Phycisphaerales bacterium]|nr:glycosyltransferase [Phycisphaerales bacterium]
MQPFWSVMIPTYNRPEVVRALRSVLAQDLGPDRMQIEVLDNCSTTLDVESLVKSPPLDRVRYHRHASNLGMHGNWNACVAHAVGRWVHILHDDDFVYPGFYQVMEAAIQSASTIAAAFCSAALVDNRGQPLATTNLEQPAPGVHPNLLDRLLRGNAIQFASIVVRRDVYEQVGAFDASLDYVADWDMWMRIAARFPFWYEPQILAAYTQHPDSETSALALTARDRRGYTVAADRWLNYAGHTPDNLARHAHQKEIFAQESLILAAQSFARNNFWQGFHRLHAALDCSASPTILNQARTYFPYILNRAPLSPEKRQEFFTQFPDHDTWRKLLRVISPSPSLNSTVCFRPAVEPA